MPTVDPIIQLLETGDKDTLAKATYFQAQVTGIETATGRVYIKRLDDEDSLPDIEPYTTVADFEPSIGDWVLMMNWGRSAVVLGTMRRSVAPSSFKLPGGPFIAWGNGDPNGVVTAPIGSIYLREDGAPDVMTAYTKVSSGAGNSGWAVVGGGMNPWPGEMPGAVTDPAGGVTVLATNAVYATYIGRADASYNNIDLRLEVITAAVTVTWAEVGIGTAPFTGIGNNASISRKGFTNVAASFTTTGEKTVAVACTGIVPGDHLWALIGSQATTQFQVMKGIGGLLSQGNYQNIITTRLSTMAVPTVFNASINPANTPFAVAWYGS